MDQQPTTSNKKIIAVVGLLVIVAVIGIGAAVASNSSKPTVSQSTATPTASSQVAGDSTAAGPSSAASAYKDGTYSATGSYDTPGGPESIGVSLTVKNGAVADSTVTSNARDADSTRYQSMFMSAYKPQVVGKSLDSISLSRVSGSSLTSGGFNDAVAQIKSQAKS
jgi:uncharacterized protein with FMN-binding domain